MTNAEPAGVEPAVTLDLHGLQELIDLLAGRGYTVLGPTLRQGAVVPGRVASLDDLPRGWGDTQEPGSYRLRRRDDEALFGYAADAISWKSVLFPSRELVWAGSRAPDGGFTIHAAEGNGGLGDPPYAVLGIRACDLHAVAVHDRVLRERAHRDEHYEARRKDAFLVTVSCSDPSGTCFCVSMGTGPRADAGYDLALTELLGDGHTFLARAGTDRGAEVLAQLTSRPAGTGEVRAADAVVERSTQRMGRTMDTTDIRSLLYDNAEHPRWDDVASRCLSCGNCTMVCPTCFCTSTEDHTSLSGERIEHLRVWDSCFTSDFSYLHGGSVRSSTRSRYRQWMTHKLASWIDQFGTSGCVGCGRCLTWCPVGIDITEEVAAIRADPRPSPGPDEGS
ncbi:4Fe-4S dicluster domain-containing protein [Nocardioides koreensis]|uniref:4Fe-4S dicluster domain-containing protein n=1 Tax=Nocardioides koreensis TaxID=433651 RepID=A0ABP5LD98_9ACTN